MIVDCHTRIWSSPVEVGVASGQLCADESRHLAAVGPLDKAIVLALCSGPSAGWFSVSGDRGGPAASSPALRIGEPRESPNRIVADYVRRNPTKMIGFAGIDPTDPRWPDELRIAQEELNLKGVIVSPEMQNFHPSDPRAMQLYEQCMARGMPVVFEQNHRCPTAKLELAQPALLDEVAQAFPELRIVVARMGYPWVEQTVVLLGKHPHLYADVAGLLARPWLSYTALLAAYEYGVIDKLLFGSDFPFRSPAACIEALYSINQFSHGSNLRPIPREHLRGIVERDALSLLGIDSPAAGGSKPEGHIFGDDE